MIYILLAYLLVGFVSYISVMVLLDHNFYGYWECPTYGTVVTAVPFSALAPAWLLCLLAIVLAVFVVPFVNLSWWDKKICGE